MRPDCRVSVTSYSAVPPIVSASPRAAPSSLPQDVAFLRACHIEPRTLAAAVQGAEREGVSSACHLLANDGVSDTLYYLALARMLDLPFLEGWTVLSPCLDPVVALRTRRARLASSGPTIWLLAPTDADVAILLKARRLGLAPPPIVITTPRHFCHLIGRAGAKAIGHEVSDGLPVHARHLSAKDAATASIGLVVCACALLMAIGLVAQPRIVIDMLGSIFFSATILRLIVSAAGLAPVSSPTPLLPDSHLQHYTVLVPLHDEVGMVEGLVAALSALDYPRSKLEVLFLLEPNDEPTRAALLARGLPPGFRVVMLPEGRPTTKPRALNLGLMIARGEFVTVFDAEDRPEIDQLRKAATVFARAPSTVACLQARLAISNGGDHLLCSLFAFEYAALFDLFNIGLGHWRLPTALGGTSNHFRTSVLRSIGGWDAWNVTEDADLGLRLARFGYETRSLNATTWEEAPRRLGSWFRQRRRWTKGWMQTLLVLTRDAAAARDFGLPRAILVALMLANLVVSPLLLPLVLAGVGFQLVHGGFSVPAGPVALLEATLAGSVAALGIGSTLWFGYIGMRKRRLERLWGALPWLLPYQILIGFAAWGGLWDLCRRPYHWHKTDHEVATDPRPATRLARSSPRALPL